MTNEDNRELRRVAAFSICDGEGAALDEHAANAEPPPSPGFHVSDDGALYYVSDRGATWLVRDRAGTVQLAPRELPSDATETDIDDVVDLDVLALAEVADGLGQSTGVYVDGEYYYCRFDEQTFLLYGERLHPVALPSLPLRARPIEDVPDAVMDAVSRALEESA